VEVVVTAWDTAVDGGHEVDEELALEDVEYSALGADVVVVLVHVVVLAASDFVVAIGSWDW
jgi:hypothetical protein